MNTQSLRRNGLRLILLGGMVWVIGLTAVSFYPRTYRATATIESGEPSEMGERRVSNVDLEKMVLHPKGEFSDEIQLTQLRMLNIFLVSARSPERIEAARLANEAAWQILAQADERGLSGRIIDEAQTPIRPILPNIPLLLFLFGGSGGAAILGGSVLLGVSASRERLTNRGREQRVAAPTKRSP